MKHNISWNHDISEKNKIPKIDPYEISQLKIDPYVVPCKTVAEISKYI